MMSKWFPPVALAVGIASFLAVPGFAQQGATDAAPERQTWLGRMSVSASFTSFEPTGKSDLYTLIDRALDPASGALGPSLTGGEVRVEVRPRWSLVLGAETGRRTVASVSLVQPPAESGPVRQQTALALTTLPYLGVERQLLSWKRASPDAPDRLRLVGGAGVGLVRYRLRQWGDFVDVDREIVFTGDFTSSGRGSVGYLSAGLQVPLRPWVALQADVNRQFGSAPMSADYSDFGRLDLGGTKVGAGIVLRPRF